MPMTPAERQRNYRERLKQNDPEKYEEIRKRNLERVKSRYVQISQLPESQQNKRRRDWRRLKYNQKNNLKEREKKTSSRKLYLKNYYKLKETIKKQNKKLEIQKKKIAALKKKCYRQKMLFEFQKTEEATTENDTITELTPNSKANSFLKELTSVSTQDKEKIKRVLLQSNILTESLAKQYADTKSNTERNIIKRLCSSELAHRYKVRTRLGRSTGLIGRIRFSNKNNVSKCSRTANTIRKFFIQDDVSRPSAGKKETRTFKKQKKQKRYLLDTVKNLHKKFKRDTGSIICYATFIKYKPFYVVKPRLADRDTCVCKVHANMKLKFIALKKIQILNSYGNLNDLVLATVCDEGSKECMYSECDICNGTPIDYNFTETNQEAIVSWIEWSSTNVEYKKKDEIKVSKRILPVLKSDKLENLISFTEAELKKFKEHLFNISHQYKSYKNFKDNLADDELVIHCDFSENYTCKMHEEIQAVHFGASQYQISLHTSVVYKKNERPKSYCTLSNSTNHSPEGIWAHLKPVLIDLKQMYPQVEILHIYSDGPTVQYKQKKNFFLFKRYIDDLGFEKGTWNFSVSYHGKGPADGVGAHIKRLLDEKVSHGKDVRSALGALNLLEGETKVKLFCIDDDDIHEIESNNENELKSLSAVPNTLKIHQVQVVNDDSFDIFYRNLSCFCNSSMMRGFCDCFSLKKHCLIKQKTPKKRLRRISSSDTDVDTFILRRPAIRRSKSISSSEAVTGNSVLQRQAIKRFKSISFSDETDEDGTVLQRQVTHSKSKTVDVISATVEPSRGLTPTKQTNPIMCQGQNSLTILSNIKVNYTRDDLRNIMKGSSRYNMSSMVIPKDFPELTNKTEEHKEPHPFNQKSQRVKNSFFDLSSDSEN